MKQTKPKTQMGQLSDSLFDLVCADWRARIDTAAQKRMTEIVRTAFVDMAACILAGRSAEPTQVLASWTWQRFAAATEASVLFTSHHTS